MLRNYIITALRNIARNRLYAAINIVGLAIGFAAAIFAALFVRDELTFNHWVPGYERTYSIATTVAQMRGGKPNEWTYAYRDVAAWLKLDFATVEAAGRLRGYGEAVAQHGNIRELEQVASADPDFFRAIQLPRVAGDLAAALDEPDAAVLTRQAAWKYFGRDAPIGDIITLDGHPMRVTGVVEDIPSNTAFPGSSIATSHIIISGRAPFSTLYVWDHMNFGPETDPAAMVFGGTFVRLKPGASITALQQAMPAFIDRHISKALLGDVKMRFVPIGSLHLVSIDNIAGDSWRSQTWAAIAGTAAIGLLIALTACINFVNATTARATRRAVEVGVRKVTGATRPELIVQHLGESALHTIVAMIVANGLVVTLLPLFQGVLARTIAFDPWRDLRLSAGLVVMTVVTTFLAGLYPAFVLSAYRPARVLKAGAVMTRTSGTIRRLLVTAQFAIFIGVAVMTAIIYRQTDYAINDSLRFDKDQMVAIREGCRPALKAEITALPGVRGAVCSELVRGISYYSAAVGPHDEQIGGQGVLNGFPVDYGFFELYGVKPLAGRVFAADRGEDAAASSANNPSIVINETAVRKFGFASPTAAIGQVISWRRMPRSLKAVDAMPLLPSRIIGVVPDLSVDIENPIAAQIYYIDADGPIRFGDDAGSLSVKLDGKDIPATLRAIDNLWDRLANSARPIRRRFVDQSVEDIYSDLTRETQVITAFATVALFIGMLGLFGLSAFTAEQRTKEIGVRKAMGASRSEIVGLMLVEFAKPVLWANVIAWPIAGYCMRQWLSSFAYHIDLSLWMFIAPSVLALAIAIATVIGHALLVARAQPVTALRYE